MIETEFNFVRGTTYSRNFNISGFEETIDNIYFTVKESENDRLPVITKRLMHGITLISNDEDVKSYNLLIDADDTEKLKVNKPYYFDVKVISIVNKKTIKKVIIRGTMTLTASVTRAFNEK